MANPLYNQYRPVYVHGLIPEANELLTDQQTAMSLTRELALSLVGSNLIPVAGPTQIGITSTTVGVTVVGLMYVNSDMCDGVVNGVHTIATFGASGSTRVDAVYIKATYANTGTGPTRNFRNPDNTTSTVTLTYNQTFAEFLWIAGVDGNSTPGAGGTPPSDYTLFASFVVNGSGATGPITYYFPTMSQIVQNYIGNYVSTVNGHAGALSFSSGNFGTLHDLGGGAIRIDPPSIVAAGSVVATSGGTDSNGNAIINLNAPVIDSVHYVPTVNSHYGAIALSCGNGNILHDLGSGAIRVDGPSLVAGTGLSAAYGGLDGNGDQIINLALVSGVPTGAAYAGYASGSVTRIVGNTVSSLGPIINALHRVAIGTSTNTLLTSGSDTTTIKTMMGQQSWTAGTNGGSGGVTAELIFRIRASSTLSLSGQIRSNVAAWSVSVDGTAATTFTSGVSSALQNWSASIPGDNAYHTLTFHFNQTGSAGAMTYDIYPWLTDDGVSGTPSPLVTYAGT